LSLVLVFWRQPYRRAGRCTAQAAAARLGAMLANPTRFAAEETLLGWIDGMRFRIWKRSLLGSSADVVQLEGVIAQEREGAVVEGTFSYKAATKLQFIGMLVLGVLILGSGAFQRLAGSPSAGDVMILGALITGVTATWILGAYWMRDRQIAFLGSRVEAILEPETP
jgi:hypothetical protein